MQRELTFLEPMSLEESLKYKYRLDADGYGRSARWKKELSTNCVVIKINAYTDYPDLFDIRAFFTGSPDGSVHSRGDLAERIAAQGYDFALERLRQPVVAG
ncbi:hypothetical protein JCM24511_10223 [Saitozyma sp. JCM 24511]|nr:hypothetical protein JCM24511_10223 [Saitozyma sp. JCM 24511]